MVLREHTLEEISFIKMGPTDASSPAQKYYLVSLPLMPKRMNACRDTKMCCMFWSKEFEVFECYVIVIVHCACLYFVKFVHVYFIFRDAVVNSMFLKNYFTIFIAST